jgi:DNA-binding MarR family transcriptional regulator
VTKGRREVDADDFEQVIRGIASARATEADVDTMVAVMQIVRVANSISQDVDSTVHRPGGWSLAGFRVMSAIAMEGPSAPARLARLAGVSQASISSVLNTLEDGGFVRRERSSTDRRAVTVSLTDRGHEASAIAADAQLERERQWLSSLTHAEIKTLGRLCRKVLAAGHHAHDSPGARPNDVGRTSPRSTPTTT